MASDSDAETRLSDASRAAKRAVLTAWRVLVNWVGRRSRLGQLLIGAVLTLSVRRLVSLSLGLLPSGRVVPLSLRQLAVSLIGVVTVHAAVVSRKLKKIRRELVTVTRALPDGGDTNADTGTSSAGVSLGCAIIGGALGASFGPDGAIAGVVFGAIAGDALAERLFAPPDV